MYWIWHVAVDEFLLKHIITVCLTAAVIFVILISRNRRRSALQLPPGPKGWPLVGYLPFVLAEKPTELMSSLREKYGNVFGFNVGHRYCVMLSDFKSVREGFTKKQLLDRPQRYMRMSTKYKTLAELKGAEWEEQRQFLVHSLKYLGVGGNRFEEKVMDEISRIIPKVEMTVAKGTCNIRDVISGSINNTVFMMVCSRWFEDEDQLMKDFLHFQTLLVESFSNNMAIIYFPWLDWILSRVQPHSKEILKSAAIIEQFIRSELKAHEKVHNENSDQDYMDLYLREMKLKQKSGRASSFTKEQLIMNSLLLLLAGTDTVRNTLEWLLMTMAIFPDIQQRVHNEIISVVGHERVPQYNDKVQLPYTEAVIMESERWKTLVPLNVLRCATVETVIQGYHIPKDTIVINNLQHCHMDPNYWKFPEEFNPDRFLSQDKSRVIVPEFFMPFSLGKRDCPGDKMANIEIFDYFCALMQKFKLSPPEGGVDFSASHRMNLQAYNPIVKVQFRY